MTDLFNAREGLEGRVPGTYLDDIERRDSEKLRAYREGREPNFDEFKPYVGDVLVPENQLEGFGRAVTSPVLTVDAPAGDAEGGSEAPEAPQEERRINVPQDALGVPVEGTEEQGNDGTGTDSGSGDSDPFGDNGDVK